MPKFSIREDILMDPLLEKYELERLDRRIREEAGPVVTYKYDPRVPSGFSPLVLPGRLAFRFHTSGRFSISAGAMRAWNPKHKKLALYTDGRSRLALVPSEDGALSIYPEGNGRGTMRGMSKRLTRIIMEQLGGKPNVSYAVQVENGILIVDFRQPLH